MPIVRAHPEAPTTLLKPPEHISYSQVAMLHDAFEYACPRKWGYRYRLNLPDPPSIALLCGRAFDAGMNAFLAGRMAGLTVFEVMWEKAITACISTFTAEVSQLEDMPTVATVTETGDALRKGLLAAAAGAMEEPVPAAVQQFHQFTVRAMDGRKVVVEGYSDRLEQDGTIVDHKWSGSPRWDASGAWDADWVRQRRDQLCVYWLARRAEEARGVPLVAPVAPRGRLVVCYMRRRMRAPTVRSLDLTFTEQDRWDVVGRIGEADAICTSGRLPARPGEACRFCSFVGRCRDDERRHGQTFSVLTGVPEWIEKEDG